MRTGDILTDIDGGPIADRGGVAGTVAKVGVCRGEQNLSLEIERVPQTEVRWGTGVFHADREKVWRALVLALASPELSQVFRVRQALKDEGVVFCDRAGPLGFTGGDLLRDEVVYPQREIVDSYPYAVWVTPSFRVRESSGATLVDVTVVIEYRGLTVAFSGTARSAGGLEGKVFVHTWTELTR